MKKEVKCTISEILAQASSFFCLIPVAIIYAISGLNLDAASENIFSLFMTIILVFVGIPVHEFLHGFGWIVTAGKSFSEYTFGFHFPIKAFICFDGMMSIKAFRFGLLLPCIVLGVLPLLLSLILGNIYLFLFASLHFVSAGSDIVVFLKSLGHNGKCYDSKGETGIIIVHE